MIKSVAFYRVTVVDPVYGRCLGHKFFSNEQDAQDWIDNSRYAMWGLQVKSQQILVVNPTSVLEFLNSIQPPQE